MIPKNITREAIIKSIEKVDREGVPKGRESKKYNLRYNEKNYPPKYIVSIANLLINGFELEPHEFSGGKESNDFLAALGFVIKGVISDSVESKADRLIDNLRISTCPIHSNGSYSIQSRTELLIKLINNFNGKTDLLIMPAGFFQTENSPESLYGEIEKKLVGELMKVKSNMHVCFGIDGRNSDDQIGISIRSDGIVAIGRKFYPTEGERNCIICAKNHFVKENGYSRVFEIKNRRFFIAVCYDAFGIRKQKLSNPGADIIINLVHGFYPKGEGGSGEVYFAKYAFAGSSKQWGCPTFGSATFFNRTIPPNWPTGVLCKEDNKSIQEWKYTENGLNVNKETVLNSDNESVLIRTYYV
jgi:hypothetical protein